MTKNRTPTPVYLDPGMHPGLEVKGLSDLTAICLHINVYYCKINNIFHFNHFEQYDSNRLVIYIFLSV